MRYSSSRKPIQTPKAKRSPPYKKQKKSPNKFGKSTALAFLSTHKKRANARFLSFLRNKKPFNSFLRNFLGIFAPFLHNSY